MSSEIELLIATPELTPFAKSGGLADVIASLAGHLKACGVNPSIIMPRYRCTYSLPGEELYLSNLIVPFGESTESADVFRCRLDSGIPVYLIDKAKFFDRECLYQTHSEAYPDNGARFIFFSRAVVEFIPFLPKTPAIIHANDWQTALIPVFVHHKKSDSAVLHSVKTLLTIHNIAFQGLFTRYDMLLTGLPWNYFTTDGLEFYGEINFLKGGIVFSDAVNTVSRQYYKDILTPEFGCGLDGLLRKHQKKLNGILNGIDYKVWDPRTDPMMKFHYDRSDLSGKQKCKQHLILELKFSSGKNRALIGMISNLNHQKGLDLFIQALPKLVETDALYVLLGIGNNHHEELLREFQKQYPDRFRFINRFDNSMCHQLVAACDMLLIPSRFEPCGFNQMLGLRYGTIPIVRDTGGLHDTVTDFDADPQAGTGFIFKGYTPEFLLETIQRALTVYRHRSTWEKIIRLAMGKDFSWHSSAENYKRLYQKLLLTEAG